MENPVIKIETDGQKVELYAYGKKVELLRSVYFNADLDEVYCEIERLNCDADGVPLKNHLWTDVEIVKSILLDKEKVKLINKFPFGHRME